MYALIKNQTLYTIPVTNKFKRKIKFILKIADGRSLVNSVTVKHNL